MSNEQIGVVYSVWADTLTLPLKSKGKKMKVLVLSTDRADLRSEVWGWNAEDADLFVFDKAIGHTPDALHLTSNINTPLEALAEGWRLLAPPAEYSYDENCTAYVWWLTKE